MKKFFKKSIAVVSALAITMGLMTGCGTTDGGSVTSGSNDEMIKIGISQYAEHPSLDNCREGFIEGLKQEGFVEGENITFDYQNAQSDMNNATSIAKNFISKKYDMVAAVATPSAQTAFNEAEKSKTPVVYIAVADPVGAQLVGEDGKSGKTVTGVSDLLPAEKQLEMIRAFLPDAKKIGVLYSTNEVNSKAQLQLLKDAAAKFDFEIVESGVSSSADIPLALDALVSKVDCINNMTDNLVVSSLATILSKANEKGIPVFGSEVEQVKNGCLASEGIDYFKLGTQSGKMAARVLKGEDITGISFETVEESQTDVNLTTLKNLGMELPEAYKDANTHN